MKEKYKIILESDVKQFENEMNKMSDEYALVKIEIDFGGTFQKPNCVAVFAKKNSFKAL